ncbi:TadE-like protein [Roseimaritima multifibrata]|uniref:TadE-like protein n=1 Tax=Roseimaritima multifibrata TaxID=1930274 RepID=A0A517MAU5_9BACT|nr:TadE/TadG family type IV pilus assembly protein [Roseimaritima multifibrata]QDS92009.1 TadE-like protein [Roseimaritima multifibrata]
MNRFLNSASPRRSRSTASVRRGAAAVEFAVCLPVLVLLVFGAIEGASFIFLKQSLNVAAYEGCREAIRNSAATAEATSRADAILVARNVNDATVRFIPADVTTVSRGEKIILEITAPTRTNSPLAGQFINNRDLVSRVVMVKE